MSRQYFRDLLNEPVSGAYPTITATSETVLIPTLFTGLPAFEPKAGKVYKLTTGGILTTGASGTVIITPRYGTVIGGTALGASPTQTVVPSISNAPFLLEYWLAILSLGQPGANSKVAGSGRFSANGAVATASSETAALMGSAAQVSVDTSVASALWMGVTFSVAPSITPLWHTWESLN